MQMKASVENSINAMPFAVPDAPANRPQIEAMGFINVAWLR